MRELSDHRFEVVFPHLRGKGLPPFIPSSDPTHVGASGTGNLFDTQIVFCVILQINLSDSRSSGEQKDVCIFY